MATNENNATATVNHTVPVLGWAFAILFVLKVAGEAGASWGLAGLSWWWVFAPLLIGFGIFFVVVAVLAIIWLFVK